MVGDYGNISRWGQHVRTKGIPFWSWPEINLKRYWRLNVNAWEDGIIKGIKTGTLTGASIGVKTTGWLTARMLVFYASVVLWNMVRGGDDWDDLTAEEKARLHLILGKNPTTGQLYTVRIQGAFSDAAAWLGWEQVVGAFSEIQKGRGSYFDVVKAVAAAPVRKVAEGITPLLKVPVEMFSSLNYWPDVFNPRPKVDKARDFARLFSVEHEFDKLTGRPTRGYFKSLISAFAYERDPGENAYFQIKGLTYDWLSDVKGQKGGADFSSDRSRALYNWRKALRYGDDDAAKEARREIFDLGISSDELAASIKRAHPLGSISKKDQLRFLSTLTAKERSAYGRALKWYLTTYIGR
jgi:hypothetical protein